MLAVTISVNAQQGQRRTAEERTKSTIERLTTSLTLTKDQVTKLEPIILANNQEMDKAFKDGQRPDRETMQKNRAALNEKIKGVLTEEQYKKYEEEQAKMRQNRGGNGGGNGGGN
jgi:Spy/CpxP family protein refolding chaperone